MAGWLPASLVAFATLLSGGGAGAAGISPTLAISTTGDIGASGDTVVVAVSSPSSRVDVDVPQGYTFPRPAPTGGHAFIQFTGGSGERGVVRPASGAPASGCAAGPHDQVWDAGFSVPVFVFLRGQRMTICPLPGETTQITVASKYWSTPAMAGTYVWKATTAEGATVTTTVRLPVRLTLVRTKRGARTQLRARMTANGAPVLAKAVHLLAGGRVTATARTRSDGSALFALRIRRRTVVYAQAAIGEEAGEPHSVRSNRLTLTR